MRDKVVSILDRYVSIDGPGIDQSADNIIDLFAEKAA
jgi:hypothetical protein